MQLEAASADPQNRTGGFNFEDHHLDADPGHVAVAHHWGLQPLSVRIAPRERLYEEYHPYGTSAYRAMKSGVEVSARRYRYTGKERDEETGLYLMGARYYACWLGRWTAADPAGTVDGTNLYRIVSTPLGVLDAGDRATVAALKKAGLSSVDIQAIRDVGMLKSAQLTAAVQGGIKHLRAFAAEARALRALNKALTFEEQLDAAASAGGATTRVVTKLDAAPEAGRALSTAAGEGADALAGAARQSGSLYEADIPTEVLKLLEHKGWVRRTTTEMSGASGIELRFSPEAMNYLHRYFRVGG